MEPSNELRGVIAGRPAGCVQGVWGIPACCARRWTARSFGFLAERKLREGEVVSIDFGMEVDGIRRLAVTVPWGNRPGCRSSWM